MIDLNILNTSPLPLPSLFSFPSRSHEEDEDEEVYVSQEGVHRAVGAEIVNNVLNGVSSSCFAYGHTGDNHSDSGSDWDSEQYAIEV